MKVAGSSARSPVSGPPQSQTRPCPYLLLLLQRMLGVARMTQDVGPHSNQLKNKSKNIGKLTYACQHVGHSMCVGTVRRSPRHCE